MSISIIAQRKKKILQSWETSIKKDLEKNKQPRPEAVLALASYKALNQYDWCNMLDTTEHIHEVFVRQIKEPEEEKELKFHFPRLEKLPTRYPQKLGNNMKITHIRGGSI